jgi:hypothetical protein
MSLVNKLLGALPPPAETPPDEPRYYAFTVAYTEGYNPHPPRTLYIMGDHPLFWIEHERKRVQRNYALLGMWELDRQLWDAIESKSLVEIDDKPLATRRR